MKSTNMPPGPPSIEELEALLLVHTAPLHRQTDSEEWLKGIFREQDARLTRRPGRARAYAATALAAAACLGFLAVATLTQQARPWTTANKLGTATELPDDDDIDTGIPEETIDDIMRQALANTP